MEGHEHAEQAATAEFGLPIRPATLPGSASPDPAAGAQPLPTQEEEQQQLPLAVLQQGQEEMNKQQVSKLPEPNDGTHSYKQHAEEAHPQHHHHHHHPRRAAPGQHAGIQHQHSRHRTRPITESGETEVDSEPPSAYESPTVVSPPFTPEQSALEGLLLGGSSAAPAAAVAAVAAALLLQQELASPLPDPNGNQVSDSSASQDVGAAAAAFSGAVGSGPIDRAPSGALQQELSAAALAEPPPRAVGGDLGRRSFRDLGGPSGANRLFGVECVGVGVGSSGASSFADAARALSKNGSSVVGECSRRSRASDVLKKVQTLPKPRKRGLAAAGLACLQQKWRRVSHVVAGVVRAQFLMAADHEDFVNENTNALAKAKSGQLDVALEVGTARDLARINYAHQGNSDMYSDHMLASRRSLRTHPLVVEAIRDWWRWLPKSPTRMVEVLGGEEDGVFAATLDQPIYSAMVVLITLVLLPRFALTASENYDPTEDWLDDNKGLPFMDFPNFFDALFELADMWSEGVGGPEYAELLQFLLRGCQSLERTHFTFSRLLRKFGYKAHNTATTSLINSKPKARTPRQSTSGGGGDPHGLDYIHRRSSTSGNPPAVLLIRSKRSPAISPLPDNAARTGGRTDASAGGSGGQAVARQPPNAGGAAGGAGADGAAVSGGGNGSGSAKPRGVAGGGDGATEGGGGGPQEPLVAMSSWPAMQPKRLPPVGKAEGEGDSEGEGGLRRFHLPPMMDGDAIQLPKYDSADYSYVASRISAYLRQPVSHNNRRRASDASGAGEHDVRHYYMSSPSVHPNGDGERHPHLSNEAGIPGISGAQLPTGGGSGADGGSVLRIFSYGDTPPLPGGVGSPVQYAGGGNWQLGDGWLSQGPGSGLAAMDGGSGGGSTTAVVLSGQVPHPGVWHQQPPLRSGGSQWQLGEGLGQLGSGGEGGSDGSGGGHVGGASMLQHVAPTTFNWPQLPSPQPASAIAPIVRRGPSLSAIWKSSGESSEMSYVQMGIPGSLYSEYMDAVMARHALRHGAPGISGSPTPGSGPPLAVLGSAPPRHRERTTESDDRDSAKDSSSSDSSPVRSRGHNERRSGRHGGRRSSQGTPMRTRTSTSGSAATPVKIPHSHPERKRLPSLADNDDRTSRRTAASIQFRHQRTRKMSPNVCLSVQELHAPGLAPLIVASPSAAGPLSPPSLSVEQSSKSIRSRGASFLFPAEVSEALMSYASAPQLCTSPSGGAGSPGSLSRRQRLIAANPAGEGGDAAAAGAMGLTRGGAGSGNCGSGGSGSGSRSPAGPGHLPSHLPGQLPDQFSSHVSGHLPGHLPNINTPQQSMSALLVPAADEGGEESSLGPWGGGSHGGSVCVPLPQLSPDGRSATSHGGAVATGGGGGAAAAAGLAVVGTRRDIVQASRAQVMHMAQALLHQQQQQPQGSGSGGGSRLESLRPLDGGQKRAQCGGSFLAYLQQGGGKSCTGTGSGAPLSAEPSMPTTPPPQNC